MSTSSAASSSLGWGSDALAMLRRFDAYPKPLDDFRVRTRFGGLLSIACVSVMALLFASETLDFLTPETKEELMVDTTRSGKLKINVDVIFDRIPCQHLTLDAMDVSGAEQINIDHNIYKRRLDPDLKPIDDAKKHEVRTVPNVVEKCGSCYGAETQRTKCCNTCQDVRNAYRAKSWQFRPDLFDVCKGVATMGSDDDEKEACQVYGYLEVNRVAGSFHIAPGDSFSFGGMHAHSISPFTDSSHRIRHLSFGRQVEGRSNPLDGAVEAAKGGKDEEGEDVMTMYQYYIKVVPTLYTRGGGESFASNQYSVTMHAKNLHLGGSGLPGVFFDYELAPIMVKHSEKEKSLGHFVTGLCAIIGGIFTVAGLIDKLFYSSAKLLQQKMDLGKAT